MTDGRIARHYVTAELNIRYFLRLELHVDLAHDETSSVKCPIVNTGYVILHVIHIYIHTCMYARLIPCI